MCTNMVAKQVVAEVICMATTTKQMKQQSEFSQNSDVSALSRALFNEFDNLQ